LNREINAENSAMPQFDHKITSAIITETGKPLANADPVVLSNDLNEVVETFLIWGLSKHQRTIKQKKDQLGSIAKHASHLVTALNKASQESLAQLYQCAEGDCVSLVETNTKVYAREPVTKIYASETVTEARQSAEKLEQLANIAISVLDSLPPIAPEQELTAHAWLISEGLSEVYEKHAGRPSGYSHSSGTVSGPAYGPWVRFIGACLEHLGIPKKPDAIVKMLQRNTKDIPGKK
jgi:hypothetical protein